MYVLLNFGLLSWPGHSLERDFKLNEFFTCGIKDIDLLILILILTYSQSQEQSMRCRQRGKLPKMAFVKQNKP